MPDSPAAPALDVDTPEDFLPINGTDCIEFYVGNAKQAAQYYAQLFGFQIRGYRGPETGSKDVVHYLLEQNDIRFVLTSSLRPGTDVSDHVRRHGDGVKDIALTVDDAERAFMEATERGATPVQPLTVHEDDYGTIKTAAIGTYGDTIHSFVERSAYRGLFFPGFEPWTGQNRPGLSSGLQSVDHCVGNVHKGDMDTYVEYYAQTMGFYNMLHFTDQDISTEYSALMSKVMANGNQKIKFPINEPAEGRKKSQIDEYLEYYQGAGVQHIALSTDDIISTVRELRDRGVDFLQIPETYYDPDLLRSRVGAIAESIEELAELNILVDRDPDGYLLQIFTQPVQDRPTLFFEIIQREGARGFGAGNFKALFEAIEREQARRGNL